MGDRVRHRCEALAYGLLLLLIPACCATRSAGQEIEGPSAFTEDEGAEYRLDVPLAEGERSFVFWVLPETLWYRTRGGEPVVTGPPGRYTIRAHAIVGTAFEDARQVEAALAIEITPRVGPSPTPPGPNPPTPGTIGPVARIIVLYESASSDGDEPFRAMQVVQAMRDMVGVDSYPGGVVIPSYRIWDDDTDASREPEAVRSAYGQAKASRANNDPATVYLFDAEGRMDSFPVPDTDEAMLAAMSRYKAAGRAPR